MSTSIDRRFADRRSARASLLGAAALALVAPALGAQCRPPESSNEAKLLAFYSAPIVFSTIETPRVPRPGSIEIGIEGSPVPTADPSIEHATICYTASAQQHSSLTSFFGRPRLTIGLPAGLAIEASYIPPVTVGDAHPHLGFGAISETVALPGIGDLEQTTAMLRVHGTVGYVHGPITCNRTALQLQDPDGPCYGTRESDDYLHPNMYGVEGVLGATAMQSRLGFFAGAGANFLRPRFEVGFTNALGVTDNTRVEVDMTRFAVLGGASFAVTPGFGISAEVYSQPKDVTTWRLAASYRVR